jgi:hypothetical protein
MFTTTLRDYAATAPAEATSRRSLAIPGLETAALFLLLALCATLRIINLDKLPVFIDEGTYTQAARIVGARPGPATLFIQSAPNFGFNPPLFSWLAAPFTRLTPDPLFAARLASACIGTLGMLATWAIGRLLWGSAAAALAGALYALSPFVLFYNRMAMLDGLLATCGAGALFFTLRLARHGRARDTLGLGLCIAAGMLTKLFAINLLLLPLLAVVVAAPRQRGAVARGAAVAAALGLLPLLYLYQNGSGLHGHLNTSNAAGMLRVVSLQVLRWASGLWLYLTPPVLLCALAGLWAVRRERPGLLVGLWTLLGTLAVVLIPNTIFAPRYVLYIAVPIVLLCARGLLALVAALPVRGRAHAPLPLLLAAATALVSVPAIMSDATTVSAPLQATLIPFDRWQYTTGWPSGQMLEPAIAYLRTRAAHGPIRVVSEDIPLYMLQVALYDDKGISWDEANFGHPKGLRAIVGRAVRAAGPSNVYMVDHRTSGGRLDPRLQTRKGALVSDRVLTILVSSPGPGGGDAYDVYGIVGKPAPCRTLFGVKVCAP